jgi:hypothetical protein
MAHVVPWHFSPTVQGSPSSQAAPGSGSILHPLNGSQLFLVQGLVSEQSTAAPAVHRPPWHDALTAHLFVFAHAVLSGAGLCAHCWVVALHVSMVQGSWSSQSLPTPTHLPFAHLSPTVQSLPSLQVSLSGRLVFTQPVLGLQLSIVQSFLSSQSSTAPGMQLPLWQASPCVQTLLSVQGMLSGTGLCTHAPAPLQRSLVHALPSSVQGVVDDLKPLGGHVVPLHVSSASHSPCAVRHTVPVGAAMLKSHAPLTHRSCVHTLASLHAAQAPPFLPHCPVDWLATGTHTPAATQPVQQLPLTQVPPGQLCPSPTLRCVQLPLAHESEVHGFESSQFEQTSPLVPHVVTVLPDVHVVPLQQLPEPLQHVVPQQVPAQQLVPQQNVPPEQQKPLQQSSPPGHPPAMQNACCTEPTGCTGSTSVEHAGASHRPAANTMRRSSRPFIKRTLQRPRRRN